MLKDDKLQKEIRPEMMKWARGYFGWNLVAEKWDALMRLNTGISKFPFSSRDKIIINNEKENAN